MNEISMANKIIMTVITVLGLVQIPCLAVEERTICIDEEASAEVTKKDQAGKS